MPQVLTEEQPLVDAYLLRVRESLSDVPAAEQDHLIEHARARIELELDPALTASNQPAVKEALRNLGDPGILAQWLRSNAPVDTVEATAGGRLTACRSCRKEVSVEANTCPHCGAPFPARQAWRGWGYEWKSKQTLWGWPLVHIAFGRDAKGKLRVAKGIIAIGQFAIGAVTFAQFGLGAIFGFGQFVAAPIAIGQVGLGLILGLGQLATGYLAIGQIGIGVWVRAQFGIGAHVWSMLHQAPEAVSFFRRLIGR
jgi:hypothetical protein